MEYPKPVMKMSELKKMGFSERFLLEAFRMQGSRAIAWKDGYAENSPICFDTEQLEKWRRAHCVGR